MQKGNPYGIVALLCSYATAAILIGLPSDGKKHGEPCDHDVGPFWGKQCATQHVLTCRNGTCVCVYDWMIYSEYHDLCLSPVGKNCGLNHNYWILECIQDAECRQINNETDIPAPPINACQCKEGFVPTTKKLCSDEQFLPNGTGDPYVAPICCPQ